MLRPCLKRSKGGKLSVIKNKLKFILLYKVRKIYMYFLKESTKDVGTFRRFPHPPTTFVLVRFVLYKSNGHKGVFSPRYRHDAAAGRGEILIT